MSDSPIDPQEDPTIGGHLPVSGEVIVPTNTTNDPATEGVSPHQPIATDTSTPAPEDEPGVSGVS